MTRVLAIANQKGGVGKTTTSVNLASALAEMGRRVLAIDLDPQGHLTINMGVRRPDELDLTVYNLLIDAPVQVEDILLRSKEMNLDFLPTNIELSGAELQLAPAMSRESILHDKLALVLDNYDFVVIDCPPSLGLLCINALVAANEVIIPLQCQYLDMKGMQQLQRTIERVKERLNPSLAIAGILPTIFKPRTLHSQEVLDLVREHYGDQVFEVRIDSSIRFAECPLAGQSILQYADRSPGARAYRELARAIVSRSGMESPRTDEPIMHVTGAAASGAGQEHGETMVHVTAEPVATSTPAPAAAESQ